MSISHMLLLFTTVGLIASILGYLDYRSGGSLCPSSLSLVSCSRVYTIPQATILGVHLSEVAPAYFTLLTATLAAYTALKRRLLIEAHALLSIAGLTLIPYLVYLELAVAKAICIYCTVMHVCIIGSSATHLYRLLRL